MSVSSEEKPASSIAALTRRVVRIAPMEKIIVMNYPQGRNSPANRMVPLVERFAYAHQYRRLVNWEQCRSAVLS